MYSQHEQIHVASWPSQSLYQPMVRTFGLQVNESAMRMYAVEGQVFVVNSSNVIDQACLDLFCDTPEKRELLELGGGWARFFGPDGGDLTTLASSLAVLGVTRSTAVQHYVVYLAKGHDDFMKLGGNIWNGVPVPILIFGAAAILLHLFLSRTVLGRSIYAHGDNPDAARLTGVATRPLTMLEYALSAGIGYVGGVVMIAETALMHLQVAESTLIFDVIMVVVLGGVSLVGGRGNVMSVVVGTLLIGVLLNGMTIMDMDVQTQNIIKGIVLLIAIVLDSYLHPRDEETSKQGD
jgi:ribose transport system permease protein